MANTKKKKKKPCAATPPVSQRDSFSRDDEMEFGFNLHFPPPLFLSPSHAPFNISTPSVVVFNDIITNA